MPLLNIKELYWAAGFLEGEGSFGRGSGKSGGHGMLRITCHQQVIEPLERLVSVLGGYICGPHRNKGHLNPIYMWTLQYNKAVSVMMMLYPLMSPKRQTQIRAALVHWKSFRAHRGTWATCQRGHELTKLVSGKRHCKTCHADREREKRRAA